MTKTKQLQAEVEDLKKQLEYWKTTASNYSADSLRQSNTIASYRKDINLQAQKHNEELTKTVTLLAKDAAQAMDDLRLDAEKAIMSKKLTKLGLNVKEFNDAWERQKAELTAIAMESVKADAALVEAKRALDAAQKAHDLAVKRKTAAEERLSTVRENLGGE